MLTTTLHCIAVVCGVWCCGVVALWRIVLCCGVPWCGAACVVWRVAWRAVCCVLCVVRCVVCCVWRVVVKCGVWRGMAGVVFGACCGVWYVVCGVLHIT